MIRLRRPDVENVLVEKTRTFLKKRTDIAVDFAAHDLRIDGAWSSFLQTKARDQVERALDSYTWGKCAYCEQIAAKDIEHFHPKSIYPSKMFLWDNFLRACKNCNNAKLAVFPLDNTGERLLIDPTSDEPLDYFVWDGLTGATGLNPDLSRYTRAFETRKMFDLDEESIREARRKTYKDIVYLFAHVVNEKPVTAETLERLRDHLQPQRPWLGMIRQLLLRSDGSLRSLVERAKVKVPEIQKWIAPWI